jgi:hypothetical protein
LRRLGVRRATIGRGLRYRDFWLRRSDVGLRMRLRLGNFDASDACLIALDDEIGIVVVARFTFARCRAINVR